MPLPSTHNRGFRTRDSIRAMAGYDAEQKRIDADEHLRRSKKSPSEHAALRRVVAEDVEKMAAWLAHVGAPRLDKHASAKRETRQRMRDLSGDLMGVVRALREEK